MLLKRGITSNLHLDGLIFWFRRLSLPLIWVKTMNLPSLVRFNRRAADLSQIELAALANVSRKVVQCVESGGDQVSWKNVQSVLAVLNVSLTPTGPLVLQWQAGVERDVLAGRVAQLESGKSSFLTPPISTLADEL